MNYNKIFIAHINDLAQRAKQNCICYSKFLTPGEAAIVSEAFEKRKDIQVFFEGGFAESERKIAVFTDIDYAYYEPSHIISAIKINFRKEDKPNHRDVLGSILGLGLKRDVLGDIFIEDEQAFIVCISEMEQYICDNLIKIGRAGVKNSVIPITSLPEKTFTFNEKIKTVASLRLDAIIAASFNLSRNDASELIKAGKVQLKYQECINPAQIINKGDIYSLKGKGKARLLDIQGESRKNRTHIIIGVYV